MADDSSTVYSPIDSSYTGSIEPNHPSGASASGATDSNGVTIPAELLSQLQPIAETVETNVPQEAMIQATTTDISMYRNDYASVDYPAGTSVSVSAGSMVSLASSGNYIQIHSYNTLGTVTIYFKDATGTVVSIVNVTIKLAEYYKEIQMGQAALTQFVGTQ